MFWRGMYTKSPTVFVGLKNIVQVYGKNVQQKQISWC